MKRWDLLLEPGEAARPFAFVAGLRHVLDRGYHCPYHLHSNLEIVYHPEGSGRTSTADGQAADFEPGDVVLYAPLRAHDQTMTEPGEDVCVQIAIPVRIASTLPSLLHVAHATTRQREELESLGSQRTQLNPIDRRIASLRATALLLDLVQIAFSALREDQAVPGLRKVQRARSYIDERFAEIRSLDEVARHAGLSHDRLRHLFKESTGKSLIAYLTDVRLARARVLLANSPMPLKQVATSCGFKDEYYFSAVFKKILKRSPGSYRFRHPDTDRARRG